MNVTHGENVVLELERLRGEMNACFARLEGAVNLLVQTTGRTQSDVDELEARVAALEARRVPVGLLAAVSGVVSALVAVVAFLVQV